MAAKYRKIDPRIWNDEKFQQLSPTQKLVALYCLTGQSNRIGIFKLSVGEASEDIGIPPEVAREQLGDVCRAMGWVYDHQNRVLYLPNWWKYNATGSDKVMKGALEDLHDVPQTQLIQEFLTNRRWLNDEESNALDTYTHTYTHTYAIGMPIPIPIPMPIPMASQEQEQEQEQDEEECCERSASESQPPPSEPSEFVFPVKHKTNKTWCLSKPQLAEFEQTFVGVDVKRELKKAVIWLKANPAKQKTPGGMLTYLLRWLSKANDHGVHPNGNNGASPPRKPKTPDDDPVAPPWTVEEWFKKPAEWREEYPDVNNRMMKLRDEQKKAVSL